MNTRPAIATALVASVVLAGCAGSPPSKGGGPSDVESLTAVAYTTNSLTSDTLGELMTQVDRSSEGTLSLVDGPAVYSGAPDGSSEVIRMVRDGEVDLGIVAARTFDLEGVTTLQALNAPLVFESPEQAASFLGDPVTEEMLAGLEPSGVVGLALVYDQMRQPLGFDGPLLDPTDLDGRRVLARPSRATEAALAALGATADPRNGSDASEAIEAGEVSAAETSMDRPSGFQSGTGDAHSAITGNLQLSVKADVIIMDPEVWTGLTEVQQDAIRDAAETTSEWASGKVVSLAAAAREFCGQHIGDVVVASPDQLVAWRTAVEPVVAGLASADPVTAAALERIEQIVQEKPSSDSPEACTVAPAGGTSEVTPSGDQTGISGIWRLEVSADALADAGGTQQDVALNQGSWTFTLDDEGRFSYVEPHGRTCGGEFAIDGDRLSMVEDPVGDCSVRWELEFSRSGDRMTWTPTPEFTAFWPPLTGFLRNPLERIGDPSA